MSNLKNKYKEALDKLFQNIPNNYENKKKLENAINKVLNKLIYAAPEIIIDVFTTNSVLIMECLPYDQPYWATKSWNDVLETHKEIISLYSND